MSGLITLTTDFGMDDAYVAAMKGVILGINPKVTIVDLCHAVQPQNTAQAAFIISTSHQYFPQGAIHVVVVDPGVGTERRAVLLATSSAFFIAPDNGVLSYIIEEASLAADEAALPVEEGETELRWGLQAFALTNPRFWRHPVSATFHGRDIFAPVAAHVSLGVSIADLGDPMYSLFTFPFPRPQMKRIRGDKVLTGRVIHIDHFGNLITNISGEHHGTIHLKNHQIVNWVKTFSEADFSQPAVLVGSAKYLEIVMNDDSAASILNASVGDPVELHVKDE